MCTTVLHLELLLHGETRFGTHYISSRSLDKEKEAAGEMVADRRYMAWLDGTLEGHKKGKKKYKDEGLWVKARIQDENWWATGAMIQEIVSPIVELLRLGDSEVAHP